MFRELVPLLKQRAVLLTLTHLEEDQIRVNVFPKQVGSGENTALTTPFSLTGTAEELDAQLPQCIVQFVGKHLELKNTLENAKAEMDAAAKLAAQEAKNKSKAATKKPEANTAAKSEPAKPEPPKPAPAPGLFDSLTPVAEPAALHAVEEEEILQEIKADEHDDTDSDDAENDASAA